MARLAYSLVIAVVCALFLIGLFNIGFLSNMHLKGADNLYGGYAPLDAIVIVAIDDTSLQQIGRWPWDRSVFASLIDQLNESKTLAVDVAFFEEAQGDVILADSLARADAIIPVEFSYGQGLSLLKPVSALENISSAYVNVLTDRDGTTRAINQQLSPEYKSLSAAAYEDFWGQQARDDKRFLVNYVGVPGSYRYVSASDVINQKVERSFFRNKLVFVGATSPGLHDDYFVPTSKDKAMPGVEIHANAVQTMITKRYLSEQSSSALALMVFGICLLIAVCISRLHIAGSSIVAFVAVLFYFLLAIRAFDHGIILNLVYGPLAIICTYVGNVLYLYLSEERERKKVYGAFSKYVSSAVIEEVMKNPEKLKLGGERKEITVFFSDVRGFTSISEKLSPEQLVHLLNEYLSAMTDIILKHQGVVDKYIGDAIMAFWGAPLPQSDHAQRAASTCLAMIESLESLQKKWKEEGFPELDIGIGLNTGPAVIGNMGSYDRFDYTAMGDTINLGSRLESITKQYGVKIIISESTKAKLDGFVTRELDLITVKGKKAPVKIYELVGRVDSVDEKRLASIKVFEDGLAHYRKHEWTKAIKCFESAKSVLKDKSCDLFIERCKAFKRSPPEKSWNGVWEFSVK